MKECVIEKKKSFIRKIDRGFCFMGRWTFPKRNYCLLLMHMQSYYRYLHMSHWIDSTFDLSQPE